MISVVTGVHLHDYGCTLKAYRREVIENINLYGEMHRFLPALGSLAGARVAEIPVAHHPRTWGRTKYGLTRTLKVVLDLLTVKFLGEYSTKPIYVFGGLGLVLFIGAVVSGTAVIIRKIAFGGYMIETPLLLLTVLLLILSAQFVLMGLVAEMITRTYHESQDKPTYVIKETVNFASEQ